MIKSYYFALSASKLFYFVKRSNANGVWNKYH
ncbi:hypothetical protein N199_08275 [Helicobacter pylori UM038]|uniref:Uncharacterized protein n=1 Tax=Helicobacter pylori UM038 TaxID=1352343 RepID=A0AAV3JQM5_HELPX|nr:hypothetical protein N199_08275 [Helicobacter pylori UM038]